MSRRSNYPTNPYDDKKITMYGHVKKQLENLYAIIGNYEPVVKSRYMRETRELIGLALTSWKKQKEPVKG